MGALFGAPWTSAIAIAHRIVLFDAEIEAEDALRIRMINQVDGEAD